MAPRTSVQAQHSFGADFDCECCDYKARATVTATGSGDEAGWTAESAEGASNNALADAVTVATRTLWFVPCPRCGQVSARGRAFKVKAMLGSLAITLASGALTFALFDERDDEGLAAILGAGSGLLFGGIFAWRWARAWVGARSRVVLEE
jgi:hypothetical protein